MFLFFRGLAWASQAKPARKDAWKLWRKACSLLREKDGKLKAKLERWVAPASKLRVGWGCFCSPSQDALRRWAGAGTAKHAAARAHLLGRLVREQGQYRNAIELFTSAKEVYATRMDDKQTRVDYRRVIALLSMTFYE